MSEQTPNKPAAEFSAGQIKATVWQNEVERDDRKVQQFSTRVRKEYFDERSQTWKTSDYYFPGELADLVLAVQETQRFIRLRVRVNEKDAAPAASEPETEITPI